MEDFNKTPKIDEPSVITLGTGDRLAEPFANLKKNQSDHWSINGRIINGVYTNHNENFFKKPKIGDLVIFFGDKKVKLVGRIRCLMDDKEHNGGLHQTLFILKFR